MIQFCLLWGGLWEKYFWKDKEGKSSEVSLKIYRMNRVEVTAMNFMGMALGMSHRCGQSSLGSPRDGR